MRTPTFQEWQHMRGSAGSSEPLTVVVVEYRADGRAVERERVTLSSQGAQRSIADRSMATGLAGAIGASSASRQ